MGFHSEYTLQMPDEEAKEIANRVTLDEAISYLCMKYKGELKLRMPGDDFVQINFGKGKHIYIKRS